MDEIKQRTFIRFEEAVEAWVEVHEQELLEQWERAQNNQPVLIVG